MARFRAVDRLLNGSYYGRRGRCCARGSVSEKSERPGRALALTAAAFQMAAAMGLCAWGGYYLDGRWGTEPWLMIVGLILGPVVGLLSISRMLRQMGGSG